jgi:hypothetical protein
MDCHLDGYRPGRARFFRLQEENAAAATATATGSDATGAATGCRAGYHGIFGGTVGHRTRSIIHAEMVGIECHANYG